MGVGLVMIGYGVNHYRNLDDFVGMSKSVFPSSAALATIAGALSYIFPALLIVGGLLFAIKQFKCISKVCINAALGGIMGWAGVAVLVGDGNAAGAMMPMFQNAAILFITYYVIKKMSCCGSCAVPNGKMKK